jgi:hypothetical protein
MNKSILKNNFTRSVLAILKLLTVEFRIGNLKNLWWYSFDFIKLYSGVGNKEFTKVQLEPCLTDRTSMTPVEPVYFFQDTWAIRKIFQSNPQHHYDVGSSVKTMGLLSQYLPVTMIDIRPIDLVLDGLHFREGSILELPFEDASIESLSSLCVVEHIGLGRYGDPVDSCGSEKAIAELKRVMKVGGLLVFSVPVNSVNKIYFNAHRAFTREYILKLFNGYEVVDEAYIYGRAVYPEYDPKRGFGTGLYMLRRVGNVC